jgi:hypothetical protein
MLTLHALITPELLAHSLSYREYEDVSEKLFLAGKTTSADEKYNTPEILEYTRLNRQRIHRLDKTTEIRPDLQQLLENLTQPWVWLVLTESWCGDAAQNIPVLAKMAELSPRISLHLLLRDEHPALMEAYLTAGGRSIPKLICLHADIWQELGTWGPRPAPVQALMQAGKAAGKDYHQMMDIVHGWYAKDRTQTLQTEFTTLIGLWKL